MSPLEIVNKELYAGRTVQDWHRRTFGKNDDAIDLDLGGFCHADGCRRALYLIEASTNPNKPTSILRRLAIDSQTPAFLVLHDLWEPTYARQIWPPADHAVEYFSADAIAAVFASLRASHVCSSERSITA